MNNTSAKRAMTIVRGDVAENKTSQPRLFNDAIETGRSVKILGYDADHYTDLRTKLKTAGFTVRTVVTPKLTKGLGSRGSHIRLHIDTQG